MRILFVGLHNKKGYEPLDPKSKSGIRLKKAIMFLPGELVIVRTNLFNIEATPITEDTTKELCKEWMNTHKPTHDDIVVLLGGVVQSRFRKHLKHIAKCRCINWGHPSPTFSRESDDDYSINLSTKIMDTIEWLKKSN